MSILVSLALKTHHHGLVILAQMGKVLVLYGAHALNAQITNGAYVFTFIVEVQLLHLKSVINHVLVGDEAA